MSKLLLQIRKIFFSERCSMCGDLLKNIEEYLCHNCKIYLYDQGDLKKLDNCYYIYYYDDKIKKLIENYKLNNQRKLGKIISEYVGEKIKAVIELEEIDTVIPVPISRERLYERGFNQVEEILSHAGIEYVEIKRVKNTKQMYKIKKREERKNNLKKSISTENIDLHGKNILIVDDILTTGATVEEIISEINKNHKVRNIYVFALSISSRYMKRGKDVIRDIY